MKWMRLIMRCKQHTITMTEDYEVVRIVIALGLKLDDINVLDTRVWIIELSINSCDYGNRWIQQ